MTTVKELIEYLSNFQDDTQVIVIVRDHERKYRHINLKEDIEFYAPNNLIIDPNIIETYDN